MREGVNHLLNCGRYRGEANAIDISFLSTYPHAFRSYNPSPPAVPLALSRPQPLTLPARTDRYLQLLMQNRARGYRGQQQSYLRSPIGYTEELKADVQEDFPTVQQAKGAAGSDKRPGYTTGFGPNGWGRY
jgi:hypothetical protein